MSSTVSAVCRRGQYTNAQCHVAIVSRADKRLEMLGSIRLLASDIYIRTEVVWFGSNWVNVFPPRRVCLEYFVWLVKAFRFFDCRWMYRFVCIFVFCVTHSPIVSEISDVWSKSGHRLPNLSGVFDPIRLLQGVLVCGRRGDKVLFCEHNVVFHHTRTFVYRCMWC